MSKRPRLSVPLWKSTFGHEGVPGHHLQIATWLDLARKKVLSLFQVGMGMMSANVEGWARYSRRFMNELGK